MKKTVWITGGSRGIGAACVHAFSQAGWKVAFCYHSRTEDAERVAAQTGAMAIQCDLTKREQVEQCAAQIRKSLGTIGAVVCNAGVAQQKMFCDLTDADWDFVMDSNLRSVFYTIQAALRHLFARRRAQSLLFRRCGDKPAHRVKAIMPHQKQD